MVNTLSPVQSKLLEMFKWLVDFLDSNNISYYALGGTLLGACRHKGFIPWDDDIDIGVPRSDYERLIRLFSRRKDHYILENYSYSSSNYFLCFSKVYDMNTSMIMVSRKPLKRGLFIDIFPLDGIGDFDSKAKKVFKKISKMKRIISRKTTVFKKEYGIKNIVYFFHRIIPLSEKKMIKKINELCTKYSFSDSKYVGNLLGSYFEKEVVERSIFGTPTIYQFENIFIKGPQKSDEYLTHIYGDWRKLPPLEKRIQHQNTSIDLNNHFSDKEDPLEVFSD